MVGVAQPDAPNESAREPPVEFVASFLLCLSLQPRTADSLQSSSKFQRRAQAALAFTLSIWIV